jgi:O-antigen ligase
MILAIWGLSSIYGYAAQKGFLGAQAQWKYAWQSSGQFGLLLGGRNEILASARAIRDYPIIGHGSWARNPAYRVFLYHLIDLGYERSQEELDRYINQSDLIPAHSHFFQAWVWAGILGAVFWLAILQIIFKVFIQSNRFPNCLYIFVIFICIGSIWDIFFSPFGSIMRLRWVFQLIILITAYYQGQQSERWNQSLQEPTYASP